MTAKIAVTVRLRPISESEWQSGARNTKILCDIERNELRLEKIEYRTDKIFKFDKVCSEETGQEDFFQDCKMEWFIKKFLSGFNITVFAYGQTGSGKTYTMEGIKYKKILESNNLQAIFKIFDCVESMEKESKRVRLSCSYMQIYNEKIYDLLDSNPKTQANPIDLKLRQNKNNDFLVENLSIHPFQTFNAAIGLFQKGIKRKIMDTHKLNLSSSRSHSIFTIHMEAEEGGKIVKARLDLVDLAGSEKLSIVSKGNESDQKFQKECIEINKSLFTLKQVINNMAQSQLRLALNKNDMNHVPFRDSKLTSLLKHSFGGNAYCLMIACIAPLDDFIEENTSTLSYAAKASIISNSPSKQEEQQNTVVRALNEKIDHLTRELIFAKKEIEFLKLKNSSDEDKNNLSSTYNTERGKSSSTMDETNSKKSSLNTLNSKVSNGNSSNAFAKPSNKSKSPPSSNKIERIKSKDQGQNYSSMLSARDPNPLTLKNLRNVISSKPYHTPEKKNGSFIRSGAVKPVKIVAEKERGRFPPVQKLAPLDRSFRSKVRKREDEMQRSPNKSFESPFVGKKPEGGIFTSHKRAISSDPSLLDKSESQITIAAARSTAGKAKGFRLPERISERSEYVSTDSGSQFFTTKIERNSSQSFRPSAQKKHSPPHSSSSKQNIPLNASNRSQVSGERFQTTSFMVEKPESSLEEQPRGETKSNIFHYHQPSSFQYNHEERHHILSNSLLQEGDSSLSPLDEQNPILSKMDFINKILESLPMYDDEQNPREVAHDVNKGAANLMLLRPKVFSTTTMKT